MKMQEENDKKESLVQWSPFKPLEDAFTNHQETIVVGSKSLAGGSSLDVLHPFSIAGKPWFVVATKADLPDTKGNFEHLKEYLIEVSEKREVHPSGQKNGWCESLEAIPVSAINGHGTERITEWTVGLLDH